MADDCIFCKIANGELGTTFAYEDDLVVAFDDLSPQAPVHVLVVPKAHYANLVDGVPAEVLKAMATAAEHVAKDRGIAESGFRAIMNTGDDAGQTVHHLHMHILGGKNLGEGLITQ